MKNIRIAIIGAGNMGSALINGLINDHFPKDQLWAVDADSNKCHRIQEKHGIQASTNASVAVEHVDVVVLAVKPQILPQVLTSASAAIQLHKPLLLSIAAGVLTKTIGKLISVDKPYPIIRAMPNLPALINCGATALFANSAVTATHQTLAENIMRAVGIVCWINDESLMDTVTALSGSGPAYFFKIMEGLQKGAEQLGLPGDIARLLTIETALGAAKMALESDLSFEALAKSVTSPGGTTEKALAVFEDHNQLAQLLLKALSAAKHRSEELASLD